MNLTQTTTARLSSLRELVIFCEDAIESGVLNADEMEGNCLLEDARKAIAQSESETGPVWLCR